MYGHGVHFSTKAMAEKAWDEAMEKAGEMVQESYAAGNYPELKKPAGIGSWGPVKKQLKAINEEALNKIKDIMPEFAAEVEKAFAEHKARLDALKRRPAGGPEGTPADKEIGTALGHLMGNLQRQLQAREARFLTAAPGGRYDYARQTARHTKQTASKQDESVKVQKKILTAIEKTGEQRFMQLLVANFR